MAVHEDVIEEETLAYGALVNFPLPLEDGAAELQIVVHVVIVEVISCVVEFDENEEDVVEFEEGNDGANDVEGEVDIL